VKKYKATFTVNESWTKEVEAENEEDACEIANNDSYVLEVYDRNFGKFNVDCDIEEIK